MAADSRDNSLEPRRLFTVQADLAESPIGRHALDVQNGVVLAADGHEAVGTDLHVNHVARLERGAWEDKVGEKVRVASRAAKSYPSTFPEVAGRAREVRWGAGVDAALVAGAGSRPGADVVALFDGEGGALGTGLEGVREVRRAWKNGSPWSIQTVPPRMVRSSDPAVGVIRVSFGLENIDGTSSAGNFMFLRYLFLGLGKWMDRWEFIISSSGSSTSSHIYTYSGVFLSLSP